MAELVIAFDIEHSGLEVIAIGASVVDSKFNQLDSFFFGSYVPNETKFSKRCWDTFWSSKQDVLKGLIYQGSEKDRREQIMINAFQEFRIKWELAAESQNLKIVLVTDNNVFDGGLINELIKKYIPDVEPIPYSASVNKQHKQTYMPFWETFSQQKGLLSVIDPSFRSDWGLSDRIYELYDIAKPAVSHDHNPANDAYTIAYDQQVLFGIQDSRIKKKRTIIKKKTMQ